MNKKITRIIFYNKSISFTIWNILRFDNRRKTTIFKTNDISPPVTSLLRFHCLKDRGFTLVQKRETNNHWNIEIVDLTRVKTLRKTQAVAKNTSASDQIV